MRTFAFPLLALGLLATAGCSQQTAATMAKGPRKADLAKDAPPGADWAEVQAPVAGKPEERREQAPPGGGQKKGPAGAKEPPLQRKIKYTAEVRLIVEELTKAQERLETALADAKGFIAQSEVAGSPGSVRSGVWRLRVPVTHFESFRAALRKLGEVEKDRSDSEDVTEEYYDLEAHIKNRQSEEEALRKLLEQSANNMDNYLSIRRELNATRDDINRKQGRLKVLANLSDLTTVTVALREKQKYNAEAPPAVAETPTFGMRVARTFEGSWGALVTFGEYVVLAVIAVAPWLVLPLFVLGAVVFLVRRAGKSARSRAKAEPPVVATLVDETGGTGG